VKKSPVARSIWTLLGGFHPMAGHQPLAALKVYDGVLEEEAKRKFQLFVKQSKKRRSKSAPRLVTLLKNYEIVREYQVPERELS
jgi:hypothetical protein